MSTQGHEQSHSLQSPGPAPSFSPDHSSGVAGVRRVSPLVVVRSLLLFYLELGGLLQAPISDLLYFILTGEF